MELIDFLSKLHDQAQQSRYVDLWVLVKLLPATEVDHEVLLCHEHPNDTDDHLLLCGNGGGQGNRQLCHHAACFPQASINPLCADFHAALGDAQMPL